MSNEEHQNPSGRSKSAATSGGSPQTLSQRSYVVWFVPVGCQDFIVGDVIDLYVTDPPPKEVTLMPGGGCDGVKATLQT